jgi:transposase
MAKIVFKNYSQGKISLFSASSDEKIPADSPARLVNQIVDQLNISKIIAGYKGGGITLE